jgi:hypothetical protein
MNPFAAGQNASLFSSYVDGSNHVTVDVSDDFTDVRFFKKSGGSFLGTVQASYSTAANTQFEYQTYWTDQGTGIRVKELGGSWTAWATSSNTDEAPIASTAQIGARNDTNHFHANYPQFKTLFLPTKASVAEYQSYIEDASNWGGNIYGYGSINGGLKAADELINYDIQYEEVA